MFDRLRTLVLRVLRVPPEPEPPFGAPGSVRVFRAGRNFYRLRLFGWGVAQAGALLGIAIWLFVLGRAERELAERKAAAQSAASNTNTASRITTANEPSAQRTTPTPARDKERSSKAKRKQSGKEAFTKFVAWVPMWIFPVLTLLEIAGIGTFVVQAFVTYTVLRLDYEMRWYIVTDRSLRIRSKIWSVQELTMSFANLQQVVTSQGPLQRLLGIADVRVQSAGGGGDSTGGHHHGQGNSMHTGIFQGVDNASEVRDLILNRLRHFRETGLGDPDEKQHSPPALNDLPATNAADVNSNADVLAAARELLAEARQLRIRVEER